MGLYLNPRTMSQIEWLKQNGVLALTTPRWEDPAPGYSIVCLVDNGPFTASAVAFSRAELDEFARPDGRFKMWFIVHDQLLDSELGEGVVAKWKNLS